MQRAGTLPLCLSLRQCHHSYHLQSNAAVVTLFLNSLWRCQSFEMFVENDLADFCLGNIERVPSTSLESVNVWCRDRWMWKDAQLLPNLLLNTRSLRTIRWSPFPCQHDTIPHSWENLRELSTDNVGVLAKFLIALSHCQNLERLEIHDRQVGLPPSKPTPAILPRVTHLTITTHAWVEPILRSLVLPSLAELELVLWNKLTRWTPIVDLLQRSGVVLRRLGITGGSIPIPHRLYQQEFIRILKMPYFQELKILEVEEPMTAGYGIVKILTLPTNSNTAGSEENDGTSGYLVHLERIFLVFQGTGAVKLSRSLQKLIKSRLETMSDPESARWHIEINKEANTLLSFDSSHII